MLCLGGCRGVAVWRLRVETAVLTVHFILAFLVIGVILLQGPKGEGLGAIGGSARMFHGPRPRETLFTRITAVLSILFVLTSTYLTFLR
jgi:preprotein translocase subunit SecG